MRNFFQNEMRQLLSGTRRATWRMMAPHYSILKVTFANKKKIIHLLGRQNLGLRSQAQASVTAPPLRLLIDSLIAGRLCHPILIALARLSRKLKSVILLLAK